MFICFAIRTARKRYFFLRIVEDKREDKGQVGRYTHRGVHLGKFVSAFDLFVTSILSRLLCFAVYNSFVGCLLFR